LPSDDHLVSSAVHHVPETSAKENVSNAGKSIATVETIVTMKDFTAFNVSSYLESMALAGVCRHVIVAKVFFLVDIMFAVSGHITREQARSSLSRVINLPDVSISVTVRGQDSHGRRTQLPEHQGQESMLEINLKTTDAQLALAAAQKTRDTAALTRAFTEQTAVVNSMEVKGFAQAVLVSTHVEAGQTLNSTMLSMTLSEKLGVSVKARVLEGGRSDELLLAAADAAQPQEASEVKRSGNDNSSSEVFFTTLAAAAMVASCLLLITLCRWKLRSPQQSKVAPMQPAVPAWLP